MERQHLQRLRAILSQQLCVRRTYWGPGLVRGPRAAAPAPSHDIFALGFSSPRHPPSATPLAPPGTCSAPAPSPALCKLALPTNKLPQSLRTENHKHWSISLLNIDAKILNEMLADKIYQPIKIIIAVTTWVYPGKVG